MKLNEANEFLLKIGQLSDLEIDNSTSNIPTSELKQWNDCLQKVTSSPELKSMQDLIDKWRNIDNRNKKSTII